MEPKPYDHLVKLLMLGNYNHGKTAFQVWWGDDEFWDGYYNTIGVDFKLKTLETE